MTSLHYIITGIKKGLGKHGLFTCVVYPKENGELRPRPVTRYNEDKTFMVIIMLIMYIHKNTDQPVGSSLHTL